jgi:prepilin-type N-terminal cleavage/methylation domain-containing protein
MNTGALSAMRRRGVRGFSLAELSVVIAIMGIFTLFGFPILSEAYRSYHARAAADDIVNSLRAVRYNAVANRIPATLTLNDENNTTAPNQYSFVNLRGQTVTQKLETVKIESGTPAGITFNNNGATGTGSQTIRVSTRIHDTRSDRYTITVTPSGTVSSAYSTF